MTHEEVQTAIETALGTVVFEPPVSVEYCAAVRDVLRPALPGATLDVFHRHRELEVQARLGAVTCVVTLPLV